MGASSSEMGASSSAAAPSSSALDPYCTASGTLEVYQRRVEPLVTGGQPNSCQQCHLSGVNLGMFVRDTPCASMACLIERGWVDLDEPAQSHVLSMIRMAMPQSALITEEVIDAEYQGFLEWIEYSARCHDGVCGEIDNPCGGGSGAPPEGVLTPLGTCDEDSIATQFRQKVFLYRDRCTGCHAAYGHELPDGGAPHFFDTGEDGPASLRSMYNILGRSLIDVMVPSQSLLLTKPLSDDVPHGGGDKFLDSGDPAYQSFLSWILDYRRCYADLPPLPDAGVTPSDAGNLGDGG